MEVAQNALAVVNATRDADAKEFMSGVTWTFRTTPGRGRNKHLLHLWIQIIESTNVNEMQQGPCLVSHLVRVFHNSLQLLSSAYHGPKLKLGETIDQACILRLAVYISRGTNSRKRPANSSTSQPYLKRARSHHAGVASEVQPD